MLSASKNWRVRYNTNSKTMHDTLFLNLCHKFQKQTVMDNATEKNK